MSELSTVFVHVDDERARGSTVNRLVHEHAAVRPDATAVSAPDGVLSYREVVARAARLRTVLCRHGVTAETTVGLCVRRSCRLVVGALAVLDAGGAYVAMDPEYPPHRLDGMMRRAGARVAITDAPSATFPPDITVLRPDDTQPASPDVGTVRAPLPQQLAYVVFTSGSTGEPKGVMVEHRNLVHLVHWHRRRFGITATDRVLQIASPGFDASIWEMWGTLAAGASLHVPDDRLRTDVVGLRDWMVDNAITVGFVPTILAEPLMRLAWPAATKLRVLLTGGDTLYRRPAPEVPFEVVNNYGPTETTVVATAGRVAVDGPAGSKPSLGTAVDGLHLEVVGADLQPVPVGADGVLLVGGPQVSRGYLADPGETACRFLPDRRTGVHGGRVYDTGDVVRMDGTGAVDYRGRNDRQVQVRGFRVELDEVSLVLSRHPAVRTCAVTVHGDEPFDRSIVAHVVPDGSRFDAEDVRRFLGDRLPRHMVPAHIRILAELPTTPNGKLAIDALTGPEPAPAVASDGPVPTVAEIADIVRTILKLDRIGPDDNVFRLGGHSFLAAQIVMRLGDRFDVDLPLRFLFEHPTVREIAEQVDLLRAERSDHHDRTRPR